MYFATHNHTSFPPQQRGLFMGFWIEDYRHCHHSTNTVLLLLQDYDSARRRLYLHILSGH